MASISMEQGLLLAGILFSLGLIGVLARRNIIFILLSLEVMFDQPIFKGLCYLKRTDRYPTGATPDKDLGRPAGHFLPAELYCLISDL